MFTDNDESKVFKTLITFEEESIDINIIKGLKKGIMIDLESPLEDNDTCFYIKILTYTFPGEILFKFYDEKVRDSKNEELKKRLTIQGVKFV